jgi:hypothetical protein
MASKENIMTTIMSSVTPMSVQDFIALGLQDVAYVKPTTGEKGEAVYTIHSADGNALAALETRDLAFAVVRQNGLEPVSVH